MARTFQPFHENFICKAKDFADCMFETDMEGGYKGYLVQRGTVIFHGTGSTAMSGSKVLERSNFFASRSTAQMYAKGHILAFAFQRKALLLRMDLCSNVRLVRKAAKDRGEAGIVRAIDDAFRCKGKERGATMPMRYSKSTQVDRLVAQFITEGLGFDGFACKRQRSLPLQSWNRLLARGKTPSDEAYFHAEIYLEQPDSLLYYQQSTTPGSRTPSVRKD
jgi:hypothetical protein